MQDFLSSPDVQMMSIDEVGCYALLIFNLYVNGGEIENDPAGLSRLCRGMQPPPKVLKKFYEREGFLRHKRVDEELKKSAKFSKVQSENARKRWKKEKIEGMPSHMPRHSHGNAEPMPKVYPREQCSSFSSSKSSIASIIRFTSFNALFTVSTNPCTRANAKFADVRQAIKIISQYQG